MQLSSFGARSQSFGVSPWCGRACSPCARHAKPEILSGSRLAAARPHPPRAAVGPLLRFRFADGRPLQLFAIGARPRMSDTCAPHESGNVKVFGRRPSRTFSHALRPASENLQGTKPRGGARIGRCRALSYGDLAVDGQRLRSAPRRTERWRWRCCSDVRRLSDLRASVWGRSVW
jgi:hypothetical protein